MLSIIRSVDSRRCGKTTARPDRRRPDTCSASLSRRACRSSDRHRPMPAHVRVGDNPANAAGYGVGGRVMAESSPPPIERGRNVLANGDIMRRHGACSAHGINPLDGSIGLGEDSGRGAAGKRR
jgi:hypothetical protein